MTGDFPCFFTWLWTSQGPVSLEINPITVKLNYCFPSGSKCLEVPPYELIRFHSTRGTISEKVRRFFCKGSPFTSSDGKILVAFYINPHAKRLCAHFPGGLPDTPAQKINLNLKRAGLELTMTRSQPIYKPNLGSVRLLCLRHARRLLLNQDGNL